MLFNSYEFIFVFLPTTFFIYSYLNHKRLIGTSKGFFVYSSVFFCSWKDPNKVCKNKRIIKENGSIDNVAYSHGVNFVTP